MNLPLEIIQSDVKKALAEDVGQGDITAALLPADLKVEAEIISREPFFICGKPWVDEVFYQIDPLIQMNWLVAEGVWLDNPQHLCTIKGTARSILTAERTALNFLQTLSATATQAYHFVQALKGTGTKVLDTRKTIPGLRLAQKYAVRCAGGVNHRLGLYDAFLIKENHIKACGSITQAIQKARYLSKKSQIIVEVETIGEFEEALAANPDRILLDNFSESMIKRAVSINEAFHCPLEVSGGVDLSTVKTFAQSGIHFISVGAITKSIAAIDLSLLIKEVL